LSNPVPVPVPGCGIGLRCATQPLAGRALWV